MNFKTNFFIKKDLCLELNTLVYLSNTMTVWDCFVYFIQPTFYFCLRLAR